MSAERTVLYQGHLSRSGRPVCRGLSRCRAPGSPPVPRHVVAEDAFAAHIAWRQQARPPAAPPAGGIEHLALPG